MKKYLILSAVLLGTAVASQAGGIDLRIGIPLPPLPRIVVEPPQLVVRTPRVVVPAPPVCVTPPVVCAPPTVYVEPYCPRPSAKWIHREREQRHRWLEHHRY